MTLILSSTLHVPHGNRYLGILPGESYSGIHALADLSICVNKYQQAFWHHCRGTVVVLEPNEVICVSFSFYQPHNHLTTTITYHMDSTPILKYSAPKGESLEPPQSSRPILINGYELHPAFIAMVREQTFSREEDKNPYVHLREFEQLCSCLDISGMRHETLK